MRTRRVRWAGIFAAITAWGAVSATPAGAVVLLEQDFEDPLPSSAMNGPGSYVVVNDPSPGWQVQGGTDAAGSVTLTAGVDANGVGGSQALFGSWNTSSAAVYTWNQYTIYGVPGSATAVPLNRMEVSLDLFVSGFENTTATIGIRYSAGGGEVLYPATVTNDAFKHVVFTLDQATGTAPDPTMPFNLRLEHGAEGFGFDDNNTLRIDNVQVQTLDIVPVLGDYSGNGAVDAADYVVWRKNDGLTGGATVAQGDGTGDGNVDGADYDYWKARFGNTSGSGVVFGAPSSVPEPGMVSLLATAAWIAAQLTNRMRGCVATRNG